MAKVFRVTGTPVAEPEGDEFLLSVPSGTKEILFSVKRVDLQAFTEFTRRILERGR